VLSGLLNLDKPPSLSSAGAIKRLKRLLPTGTKIGHAGTLDPFATGVLVVLVGRATRRCEELMDQPKEYEAAIRLEASTATLDPDSAIVPGPAITPLPPAELAGILTRFVGAIAQVPPAYSALKLDGRRACDIARRGVTPLLQSRQVRVYGLTVLDYQHPRLEVRVACGRGTYVRALARDIAAAMGTTGYLTALRRTRVGDLRIEEAVTLERLLAEGIERHLR
jgi:tRNA pseudouridine55 synthase